MADYRRQPEWDQHADRHTHLIDPVITVRQLARFDFRKPPTRIDHALVFSTPRGAYDTYLPPVRPTRAEAATKRYSSVYEVDMGVHPVQAELALPSDNDAFEFGCVVELSWQVVDPARFVASGYRDVPTLLLGELEQAARPVARRHPISESAAAERELLSAVSALGALGGGVGLKVSWTVRLRRDQENIDHQKRLQGIQHDAAEQVLGAQLGANVDIEVARRTMQQDALALDRAAAYGQQNHALTMRQQEWEHQQALLAGQHALDLQRIEAAKIDFYQYHLAQGGVHAWALHLAQHPEDSALVMNSMREDQLRMIQAQMDLVGQLLAGDVTQDYELDGPKQLALRTMSDVLNQRLPGVTQQPGPQPPAPPGHPGGPVPGSPALSPGAGTGGWTAPQAGAAGTGPQVTMPGAAFPQAPADPPGAGAPGAGPGAPWQQPYAPGTAGTENPATAGADWTGTPYGAGQGGPQEDARPGQLGVHPGQHLPGQHPGAQPGAAPDRQPGQPGGHPYPHQGQQPGPPPGPYQPGPYPNPYAGPHPGAQPGQHAPIIPNLPYGSPAPASAPPAGPTGAPAFASGPLPPQPAAPTAHSPAQPGAQPGAQPAAPASASPAWQPPPGYGSAPVMPRPGTPPTPSQAAPDEGSGGPEASGEDTASGAAGARGTGTS
ncbi:hypothetical protein OG897_25735 [Streptomyces sp. NBC_00237]|uniref:hypothetical protein n=1 Tax=Streptomyces sp. NBC_00237 TaxID=2975687 RepID=UPI0022517DA4|nr:hypothetical protein [Streptomyces sp. NBC_00237]MCX5204845.1 hypothetical protein [Streptomyces sp. NBC_00237]